jgi:hypothetical protein
VHYGFWKITLPDVRMNIISLSGFFEVAAEDVICLNQPPTPSFGVVTVEEV